MSIQDILNVFNVVKKVPDLAKFVKIHPIRTEGLLGVAFIGGAIAEKCKSDGYDWIPLIGKEK